MALRLNQIKKPNAPRKKNEESSFVKDKTLAPFEIDPSDDSNNRAQLEHKDTASVGASLSEEKSDSVQDSVSALPANDLQPPALDIQKTESASLNDSSSEASTLGARLEYSNSRVTHENGAQLEHKIFSEVELKAEGDTNKSTIGAQLESDPKPVKSTIRAQYSKPPLEAKRAQLEHSKSTIGARSGAQLERNKSTDDSPIRGQLESNKGTDKSTNRNIYGAQLEHRTLRSDYEMLSGHELSFLKFIHRNCVENGSKTSSRINNQIIAEHLGVKPLTLKTVVKRVVDKGYLDREAGKRGRGGFLQFTMSDELYAKLLFTVSNKSTIGAHAGVIQSTDKSTDKSPESPSSSSLNINTTSRTEEPMPELWKDIVIPPYLASRGFSLTHAKQVLSDKANTLSVEDVQESFDNFCADLENNKVRIQSTPIQFLMGVLRKRREKYESVFLSEQFEAELLAHQKQLQRSQDSIKAAKMEALAGKYEEWKNGLSSEQVEEIAPSQSRFDDSNGVIRDRMLKAHFNKMNGVED